MCVYIPISWNILNQMRHLAVYIWDWHIWNDELWNETLRLWNENKGEILKFSTRKKKNFAKFSVQTVFHTFVCYNLQIKTDFFMKINATQWDLFRFQFEILEVNVVHLKRTVIMKRYVLILFVCKRFNSKNRQTFKKDGNKRKTLAHAHNTHALAMYTMEEMWSCDIWLANLYKYSILYI